MAPSLTSWMRTNRTLLAIFGAVIAALIVGLVVGGALSASETEKNVSLVNVATRTTNEIQLDNGTCGHNLQLGTDNTASSSATPTFLIYGDGGASVYTAKVDGQALPNSFTSDVYGNVCVTTGALSDGPHLFTAHEVAPPLHAQDLTPFAFSVDTQPPSSPSQPILSDYSDSPPIGDGMTKYRSINFHGTSDPGVSVQLYNGPTGVAGAHADTSGNWSATTSTLSDGTYNIAAAAFDQAGNKSALSAATRITVSQEGQTNTPGAATLLEANRSVVLRWAPPTSDGNSPILSYKIYTGAFGNISTLIAVVGGNVSTYTVPDAEAWQYFAVAPVNALGEGPKSNTL